MDRLSEFLQAFYEAMSFASVDAFDCDRFAALFTQNALIAERYEDKLCTETIGEYLTKFLEETRQFPELYSYGLNERQTGYSFVDGDDYVLVKSAYEKKITKYTEEEPNETVTEGCNFLTLCKDGDWFRILSIAWTAVPV